MQRLNRFLRWLTRRSDPETVLRHARHYLYRSRRANGTNLDECKDALEASSILAERESALISERTRR